MKQAAAITGAVQPDARIRPRAASGWTSAKAMGLCVRYSAYDQRASAFAPGTRTRAIGPAGASAASTISPKLQASAL